MPQVSEPKIITLDIETAPLKSYHWGLWKENIGLSQIANEWTILSVAWKWLDEKVVHCLDTRGAPRDDGELLLKLWTLLDEADIAITQNGIDFDIKKINARLIATGFTPYSPLRHIDTKVIAKKHFGFTSNRLEWMGKNIAGQKKSDHRKFPGFELWVECLADNPKAWNEMAKYNKQDVLATEALYLKLRPWVEGHPNLAIYGAAGAKVEKCPKCGSPHIQMRGIAHTNTGAYQRMRCNTCGGWSRSRKTLLLRDEARLMLGN